MNVALVLSGGTGMRLGAKLPKQYIEVRHRPIISYCVETLLLHKQVDALQIVADSDWQDKIWEWLKIMDSDRKFHGFSAPGENRQLSIWQGLLDIRCYAPDSGYVLIHDAARPLLSTEQITDCLCGVVGHDGLMPSLPMKDTVYTSADGGRRVSSLLDRSMVYAGQAPEVFQIGRYYEANRKLLPDRIRQINGSTEPAILDGMDIVMIPGDERNFKITTRADLERFQKIREENI